MATTTTTTTAPLQEQISRMTPVSAPREMLPELETVAEILARLAEAPKKSRRPLLIGPAGEQIPLPEPMFHLVARLAEVLARGDAVTIVPVGQELTTQQAADLLNVSRQYLIRLLDDNELPFTRTEGQHRRLRIDDILAYKTKREQARATGLDELAAMTQDMGGYPELDQK